MIVDKKEPGPPSYQAEIGESQHHLGQDADAKQPWAGGFQGGFRPADGPTGSGLQKSSASDYDRSYNAMGSQDTRDDPFHPPPGTGYLGYSPQPNRSSADIERNAYQPYQPHEHHASSQDEYQQTPLVGGAPKDFQNMSECFARLTARDAAAHTA